MTCRVLTVPRVDDADRVQVRTLGDGIVRVVADFGFLERSDVPLAVRLAADLGVPVDRQVTYVLSHITLHPTHAPGLAYWRKHVFASMSRNSLHAATYLGVPSRDAVELGIQVDI